MKSRRKLLTAGLLAGMLLSLPTAEASVGTFHAVGEYTMSDYDNPEISEIRALDYARQSAVEQAGVYVGNYTRTVNMQVTDDEIMAISSSNIKITDKQIKRTLLPTGDVRIQAEITATVDTAEIDAILNDKTQKLQEQQRKYLDLKARRDKLESAAQKLKQQIAELKSNDAIEDFEIKEEQERQNRYRQAEELANTIIPDNDDKERVGEITRKILLLNPKDGKHWVILGVCQLYWPGNNPGEFKWGDDAKLAPYMTKALILDPEDLAARGWRAMAYEEFSDDNIRKKAIQDLDFIIEKAPDADNYKTRADAYIDILQDYQHARNDYMHAVSLAKSDDEKIEYYLAYAWRYGDKEQYYAEVMNIFDKCIALRKNNPKIYLERALFYRNKGEYQKAIDDLTSTIIYYDSFVLITTGIDQKSSVYNQRGKLYQQLKQYDKALADYNNAILEGDHFAANDNKAEVYVERGDYKEAINCYTDIIQNCKGEWYKRPKSFAYKDRAQMYIKIEEHSKAVEDITQIISMYNNVDYTTGGDFNKDFWMNAFFIRGLAYLNMKMYDKAIADYTQAIAINSKEDSLYNNRGVAYKGKGELKNALHDFEKAVELNPADELYQKNFQSTKEAIKAA